MPLNSQKNHQYTRDNQDRPSAPVRKTILRNPEVPFKVTNEMCTQTLPKPKQTTWRDELSKKCETPQQISSQTYHEPRLNKVVELSERLKELKMYEAMKLNSTKDLSQNSKEMVNREVS
jgi:hypothetical protein